MIAAIWRALVAFTWHAGTPLRWALAPLLAAAYRRKVRDQLALADILGKAGLVDAANRTREAIAADVLRHLPTK